MFIKKSINLKTMRLDFNFCLFLILHFSSVISQETDSRSKNYWNFWPANANPSPQSYFGPYSPFLSPPNAFQTRPNPFFSAQNYRDVYSNPYGDCPTGDGNRTGICVASAGDCLGRGGRPMGNCYASSSVASNPTVDQQFAHMWPNQGIPVGICCFYQATCGATILQNGTYFRSPNAPSPYTDSRSCSVTVQPIRRDICQLRLDFLAFDIGRPNAGNCDTDRFVVSGQSQNSLIPAVCGYNTGQHMYVEVNIGYGPIILSVLTLGSRNRHFDIRVSQISCVSPYRAPANCLQYYTDIQGGIKSFNYDETKLSTGGYLNNLDYTICVRREPGFCTATYSLPIAGPSDQTSAAAIQALQTGNFGATFSVVSDLIGEEEEEAGAGPYECTTDYLILANTRLCGSRLNGQLYPASPNPTFNAEIFDNSSGPIYARFVTNQAEVSRGFNLVYRLNPCLING